MENKPTNKSAFDAAVKYLAASPRSEKEVKEKLYQKGYHKNEVEEALKKCREYRYLDDEAYVKSYLLSYGEKYGRKKIIYALTFEKNVDKQVVEDIVFEALTDETEKEKGIRFAKKYIEQKQAETKAELQKVGAHLYSKGFDYAVITSVMAALRLPTGEEC